MRDAHALAAAAGGSLDHHGIADLVGNHYRMLFVLDDAEMARHGRDLCLRRRLLRFDLVAHCGDGAGIRSNEDDAGRFKRARKSLAFGQEPVARMHGLGAGLTAGVHDLVDQQIAFGRRRRADQHGLIGHLDMQCIAIGFRVDGYRFYSHAARSLDDPAGDFAAICDQNSFEHVVLLERP